MSLAHHSVDAYAMGFKSRTTVDGVCWEGRPDMPFRLRGLLVWGVTDATRMIGAKVGQHKILTCSAEPMPARFFESGRPFAEMAELLVAAVQRARLAPNPLEEKLDAATVYFLGVLRAYPEHEAHQVFYAPTCEVGMSVAIEVTGPLSALAVWGLCLNRR